MQNSSPESGASGSKLNRSPQTVRVRYIPLQKLLVEEFNMNFQMSKAALGMVDLRNLAEAKLISTMHLRSNKPVEDSLCSYDRIFRPLIAYDGLA